MAENAGYLAKPASLASGTHSRIMTTASSAGRDDYRTVFWEMEYGQK